MSDGVIDLGKEFQKAIDIAFEDASSSIYYKIIEKTPIDTGALKSNFRGRKSSRFVFDITNTKNYAHQIMILGKTGFGEGSNQLPEGILPTLSNFRSENGLE